MVSKQHFGFPFGFPLISAPSLASPGSDPPSSPMSDGVSMHPFIGICRFQPAIPRYLIHPDESIPGVVAAQTRLCGPNEKEGRVFLATLACRRMQSGSGFDRAKNSLGAHHLPEAANPHSRPNKTLSAFILCCV